MFRLPKNYKPVEEQKKDSISRFGVSTAEYDIRHVITDKPLQNASFYCKQRGIGLKNSVNKQMLDMQPTDWIVLKQAMHIEGEGRCRGKVGTHFHSIVKFSPQEKQRWQNRTTKSFSRIPFENAKIVPSEVETKMDLTKLLAYLDQYQVMEIEDEVTESNLRVEEHLEQAKQDRYSHTDKLRQIAITDTAEYDELKAMFPHGSKSYDILFSESTERGQIYIDKQWARYKKLQQAEKNAESKRWMNMNDAMYLSEKYPKQCKMIQNIVGLLARKRIVEGKIPIFIQTGVSNAGKTWYQKVISQAYGNTVDLQDTQLVNDALAYDDLVKLNASVICFEEFKFENKQHNNISMMLEKLKMLTSGHELQFRTCKNSNNRNTNNTAQIDAIFICSNQDANELRRIINDDSGLRSRIITYHHCQAIPEAERFTVEQAQSNKTPFIKFAKLLRYNYEEQGDDDIESLPHNIKPVTETAQNVEKFEPKYPTESVPYQSLVSYADSEASDEESE